MLFAECFFFFFHWKRICKSRLTIPLHQFKALDRFFSENTKIMPRPFGTFNSANFRDANQKIPKKVVYWVCCVPPFFDIFVTEKVEFFFIKRHSLVIGGQREWCMVSLLVLE